MKRLSYFIGVAAVLSAMLFTADVYGQRGKGGGRGSGGEGRGGERGGNVERGRGGERPAPQARPPRERPAPQVRPAPQERPAPQVRTPRERPAPQVRTPRTDVPGAGATIDREARRPSIPRQPGMPRVDARVSADVVTRSNVSIGRQSVNLASPRFRPAYQNYAWHRGYWNNLYGWNPNVGYWPRYGYGIQIGNIGIGYGGYGGYGFGRYPVGWGYGGWGLGNMVYGSGYWPYDNPFWGGYDDFYVYDYARPIPVAVDGPSVSDIAARDLSAAREAFKAGDYKAAFDLVNRAIKNNPSDSVLHEFRALTQFALQDYEGAAATIHSVLAVGPGWDWATMAAQYDDVNEYTGHLRSLEAFAKEHPDKPAAQFLLSYHYITTGYPDAAVTQLRSVVKQVPQDRVAKELLALIDKPKESDIARTPPPVPTPEEAAPPEELPVSRETARPIDAAAITGHWQFSRDDGSKFDLDLKADQTFTWKFEQGDRKEDFSGTFSTEGSLLILQREEGGAMVGQVKQEGEGKFTFKLLGAPPDDPGLSFSRS